MKRSSSWGLRLSVKFIIEDLFVLGGVVAIGRCLSALELFGLARNELAGGKCNAVLLCIGF